MSSGTRNVLTLGAASIAGVLFCGLLCLADPLGGDQSLFLIGAHEMHRGAVLYTGFWDLKQPGVYAFYYLATMFGSYSPVAIHLAELAYMASLAALLFIALRRFGSFSQVAAIVPVAAVAFYYLAAGSFEQIQVESLAGLPLFLMIWSFCEGTRAREQRARILLFAGGGAAAAVVLLFKLVFLPIVLLAFCAAFAGYEPAPRRTLGTVLLAFGAAALGLALPLAATLYAFAAHGALDAALQTWFVVPPRVVAEVPAAHQTAGVLLGGIRWFAHRFFGIVVLAGIGAFVVAKRRPDSMAFGLAAWTLAGAGAIVLQVTSWFQYHWLLLGVPLGAFAAVGIKALWDELRMLSAAAPRRVVAGATLAVAVVLVPGSLLAHKVRLLAANHFAVGAAAREHYREAESPVYAGSRRDAPLISGSGGALYVLGNPTFYVVTGKLQGATINGSSARLLLAEQWTQLEREFVASPPHYLYISHAISVPSRSFRQFVAGRYRLQRRGTLGDVFIPRQRLRS